MFGRRSSPEQDALTRAARVEELANIAKELGELRGQVAALRTERDRTKELTDLARQVESLKLERGRLTEEHDRKIRETEHKVGLLRTQQEHDVANATRESVLKVREENLGADKQRFADEMTFQREHLQREVDRIEKILTQVLERLPNIEATFTGRLRHPATEAS